MAVVSVRFNEEELKILKKLSQELQIDQSTLIKQSIMETYENLVDRQLIDKFEKSEVQGQAKFSSFEQIIGS